MVWNLKWFWYLVFIVYSQYESIKLIQTKFIQTSESACHQIQWNFHNGAQMYSFSWKLKENWHSRKYQCRLGKISKESQRNLFWTKNIYFLVKSLIYIFCVTALHLLSKSDYSTLWLFGKIIHTYSNVLLFHKITWQYSKLILKTRC